MPHQRVTTSRQHPRLPQTHGDEFFDGYTRRARRIPDSLPGAEPQPLFAELRQERAIGRPLLLPHISVQLATRLEVAGALRIRGFMLGRPEGFASLEEAADTVAEYLPHRRRPTDLRGLERNLRRDRDGRWRWHWDPSFLTGPRPPADVGNRDRLSAAARALRLPTLLIRGQLSDVVSEEGAREFLALVPNARYVDVSGTGHMVAGDRNDAFTLAVLEFLRDLAGGNGRVS